MMNQLLNIIANAYVNLPNDHALIPVFQQLPVLLRTMCDLQPTGITNQIISNFITHMPYVNQPHMAILDWVIKSQGEGLTQSIPNAHLTNPQMNIRLTYLKCEFFACYAPDWWFQATANVCSYIHDDVRIAFLNEKLEATQQTVKIIAALQPIME